MAAAAGPWGEELVKHPVLQRWGVRATCNEMRRGVQLTKQCDEARHEDAGDVVRRRPPICAQEHARLYL